MFLAINPGGITTPLIGTPTTDPAFRPAGALDRRAPEGSGANGRFYRR
jgi:flagellar biosynthesis protein FlhA